MVSTYPACIYEGNDGYSVIFPDFSYLSTCGTTLQEAEKMAVVCLAGALYSARIDGEEICKPLSIANVDAKKIAEELGFEYKSDFVNLISVDVEEYSKRKDESYLMR